MTKAHDFNQILSEKAVPFVGNDVDTDRIVPARFLKEITFDKMGDFLFYDVRYLPTGESNPDCSLNDERFKDARILIVEENFGCGSSREHAPQAIQRYGFQCIIGVSFAEIFAGNCRSLGVPTLCLSPADIKHLMAKIQGKPDTSLSISLTSKKVMLEGESSFEILNSTESLSVYLNGEWNALNGLKANVAKIQEKAAQIPYFNNFER